MLSLRGFRVPLHTHHMPVKEISVLTRIVYERIIRESAADCSKAVCWGVK